MDDPITQRTITPRQRHDFNEKLFHWILKDCPILVSTLSGDQMEIMGCDLSTVEQIAKQIGCVGYEMKGTVSKYEIYPCASYEEYEKAFLKLEGEKNILDKTIGGSITKAR